MSIKIPITIFFFIALCSSSCLNASEPVGKCTVCTPLDVLITGNCYPKIRGCMRYGQGPICIECQNGYVSTKNICVRQAEYYNRTNLTDIPPVSITPVPVLTLEEIRNKLGEKYGAYFTSAHQYFISKYSQLQKASIRNVERLKTKVGDFLIIEYQVNSTNSTNKYHAVSFVNIFQSVTEWAFSPLGKQKVDPITADKLIRASLNSQIKDFFIYQFTRQTDLYIIDYMNNQFKIVRVTVNNNDLGTWPLIPKLTTKNLALQDLAKQLINSQYPNLINSQITEIVKYNDFYVAKLSNSLSISYQFRDFRFKINKPYDSSLEFYGFSSSPSNYLGFANFTDFIDTTFKISIQYCAKQFPELVGAIITRAQKKNIENGQLFLLNLKKIVIQKNETSQYELKIWVNSQNIARMIWAKKNKQFIYSTNYNYNSDEVFFYTFPIVNESKVSNVPIISSVIFKKEQNRNYYKVIFSEKQFSEIIHSFPDDKSKLISYFIDGQNLLTNFLEQKAMAQKRSPSLLLTFLKGLQQNAANAKIKQIAYNAPSEYILTVVSSGGTFNAVILDSGELQLSQYNKLSDVTCFDLKQTEVVKSSEIKAIDEFLKANYDIQDLNIQLVQINVGQGSYVHRILYSNKNLKQVQFYIEEREETANVMKASFINSAFEIVQPVQEDSNYQKILAALTSLELIENKIPFFVEANATTIKAYCNDGKNTIQIIYDKRSKQASPQTIYTRPYSLIPDGFSMQNLKIPATPTPQQSKMIIRINQEALKKFAIVIKDSTLAFVDKINSTYNLMFKNQYGYQKIQAKIDEKGGITVGRLVITGYRQGDFSNCKKYNIDGKCLSCEIGRQIQYQGGCHKKIEGCLIQAGPNCVKCNANYIKSSYKCYNECSLFLK